jgi:hypothetical protein
MRVTPQGSKRERIKEFSSLEGSKKLRVLVSSFFFLAAASKYMSFIAWLLNQDFVQGTLEILA